MWLNVIFFFNSDCFWPSYIQFLICTYAQRRRMVKALEFRFRRITRATMSWKRLRNPAFLIMVFLCVHYKLVQNKSLITIFDYVTELMCELLRLKEEYKSSRTASKAFSVMFSRHGWHLLQINCLAIAPLHIQLVSSIETELTPH